MTALDGPDLTATGTGLLALAVFVVAYGFVIAEEFTSLRKSKPVVIAAGVIWMLVAVAYGRSGGANAGEALQHHLTDYAELLLFLLAAMTYVNTMQERQVFAALRSWVDCAENVVPVDLLDHGRGGVLTVVLLDNLTTALVMGAVVLSVGRGTRSSCPPCQCGGRSQRRRRLQPVR
jgi:Na+/H+ antiporter NhaD/arsenite permease-like protein